MATTVQEVIDRARPYIGDVKLKSTDPETDLAWGDTQLASIMPSALGLMVDLWGQQYTAGVLVTSEFTPDPDTHDDIDAIALFLAKTALMTEQGRAARRAVVQGNAAGSTNLSHIPEALARQLKVIDDQIDSMYRSRMEQASMGDIVLREIKTEDGSTLTHTDGVPRQLAF